MNSRKENQNSNRVFDLVNRVLNLAMIFFGRDSCITSFNETIKIIIL